MVLGTMIGIYNYAACLRQKPKPSSHKEMNRFEKKTPEPRKPDVGWTVRRTKPLLSVAGGVFLDFPLNRTG